MRRAISLSRRGFPMPNPHVGCVIVQDGVIVGEGHHDYAGGPHAEIVALRRAGFAAKGADVFVTLEPCAHHGRTPPCADALIEAGVGRVFASVRDPNPKAQGGVDRLRERGIEVVDGVLTAEAADANSVWLEAHRLGRPYVLLKAAITLDGMIARPDGSSKWITGPGARRAGHRLRAAMGSVLVGAGTVRADDPRLTARIPGVVNQPTRIILDPSNTLPPDARVFDSDAPTLHVVCGSAPDSGTDGSGRQRFPSPCLAGYASFDLKALLDRLWQVGIRGVLVEGGARTLGSFLDAGLFDGLELFVAPRLFGEGLAWAAGSEARQGLNIERVQRIDQDLRISLRNRSPGNNIGSDDVH